MARDIKSGDIVVTCFFNQGRELFHYGIVAFNTKRVYHFDVKDSLRSQNTENKFHATSWDIFLEGAIDIERDCNIDLRLYNTEQKNIVTKAFILDTQSNESPKLVLERARILEILNPKYSIQSQNCEHAAVWCNKGEWYSSQISQISQLDVNILEYLLQRNILIFIGRKQQREFKQSIINGIEEFLAKININLSMFRNYREINTNSIINKRSIYFNIITSLSYLYYRYVYPIFTLSRKYSDNQLRIDHLPDILINNYRIYQQKETKKNEKIRKFIISIVFTILVISILCTIFLPRFSVIKSDYQTSSKVLTKKYNLLPKIKNSNDSLYSFYTVKNGDTLWDISFYCYKNASRWRKIRKANPDLIPANSQLIKKGWILKIPGGCQRH